MNDKDHLIMGTLFVILIAVIGLLILSSIGCLPEAEKSGYEYESKQQVIYKHSKRADADNIYSPGRRYAASPENTLIRAVESLAEQDQSHTRAEDTHSDANPKN
jgi:predicted lipid-binding transport protein (Tim44 family)